MIDDVWVGGAGQVRGWLSDNPFVRRSETIPSFSNRRHKRKRFFFLSWVISFVPTALRFSSAATVDFGRRRAQRLSRPAVAPSSRHAPPFPGRALYSFEHGGRLDPRGPEERPVVEFAPFGRRSCGLMSLPGPPFSTRSRVAGRTMASGFRRRASPNALNKEIDAGSIPRAVVEARYSSCSARAGALELRQPRLQRRILGLKGRDQREQVFQRRRTRRFASYPMLESEPASAVERIFSSNPAAA